MNEPRFTPEFLERQAKVSADNGQAMQALILKQAASDAAEIDRLRGVLAEYGLQIDQAYAEIESLRETISGNASALHQAALSFKNTDDDMCQLCQVLYQASVVKLSLGWVPNRAALAEGNGQEGGV